tara:strand:+ start:168 stop:278 length:111 start_codon:yes stop_codon:yes gene_type:complete
MGTPLATNYNPDKHAAFVADLPESNMLFNVDDYNRL